MLKLFFISLKISSWLNFILKFKMRSIKSEKLIPNLIWIINLSLDKFIKISFKNKNNFLEWYFISSSDYYINFVNFFF
jgi:hypothetical protein